MTRRKVSDRASLSFGGWRPCASALSACLGVQSAPRRAALALAPNLALGHGCAQGAQGGCGRVRGRAW